MHGLSAMSRWDTMALLSELSPQPPWHSEKRTLAFAISLIFLSTTLAGSSPALQPHTALLAVLYTNKAHCCPRALALSSLGLKRSSTNVHMVHYLPSFRSLLKWHLVNLSVRLIHHLYKMSPTLSISPLSWFVFLVLLTTIGHITYLLVHFLPLSMLQEGKNSVLFIALKMSGT